MNHIKSTCSPFEVTNLIEIFSLDLVSPVTSYRRYRPLQLRQLRQLLLLFYKTTSVYTKPIFCIFTSILTNLAQQPWQIGFQDSAVLSTFVG
jgi:hypothetical protein